MTDSYQIQINGRLGPEMAHLLADLDPDIRSHTTGLRTDGADQESLHRILNRLRDLGLTIESVTRSDTDSDA